MDKATKVIEDIVKNKGLIQSNNHKISNHIVMKCSGNESWTILSELFQHLPPPNVSSLMCLPTNKCLAPPAISDDTIMDVIDDDTISYSCKKTGFILNIEELKFPQNITGWCQK